MRSARPGASARRPARAITSIRQGARAGQRDPEVEALIARISAEKGVTRRSFTADEIVARLMDPMVNEGARILEEGIAARPGDIDIIWLNGYNWPAWREGRCTGPIRSGST
jgi:3-hydroxyacyl-CoA dehydrogenase